MYLAHFRLDREPFSLTPDPRFLFLSARHREALAHLLYGLEEKGGFIQLTGEVGAGKTTLCRSVLDTAPAGVDVALLLNPRLTAPELLATVCDELSIPYPAGTESLKVLVDCLNRRLLEIHARGRRAILIVDEAQQLSADVLEQIRLLSNLETSTAKLLQIVLIGQPELQTLMARPELRQLAQRISARYHLGPLSSAETAAYVRHRLAVAGCVSPLFTGGALAVIHRRSRGIPRLVNVLCDRALLGAYARGKTWVGAGIARRAAREVEGRDGWSLPRRALAWGLLGLVAAAGTAAWRLYPGAGTRVQASSPPAAAVSPPEAIPTPAAPRTSAVRELAGLLARGEGADPDAAYEAVLGRWGLAGRGGGAGGPCDRAEEAGLRCLGGRGGWEELSRWNLPAVLELRAGARRGFGAVLSRAGGRVAVAIGSTELEVPLPELEALWTGGYVLLWRPPPGGTRVLGEGAFGPRVRWLRERLDRAIGPETGPPPDAPEAFDARLRERLVAFQRAEGLRPDGRAGVQTFARLARGGRDGSAPTLGPAERG